MDNKLPLTAKSRSYDLPYHPGRVYDSAIISSVFGEPYDADDKTLIPVKQVRSVQMGWSSRRGSIAGSVIFAGPLSSAKPVAVIEVDQGEVRIVRTHNRLPAIIAGVMLGAWNIYWLLRTVRELRARRS